MPTGATVNLETFSDADFSEAFQWEIDGALFDFTGYNLLMNVRHHAEDVEAVVSLDSVPGGFGGITFNDPVGGHIETFNIFILRSQMIVMAAGEYVQSLILLRPDGLRDDIWHGTLTHSIGPTR